MRRIVAVLVASSAFWTASSWAQEWTPPPTECPGLLESELVLDGDDVPFDGLLITYDYASCLGLQVTGCVGAANAELTRRDSRCRVTLEAAHATAAAKIEALQADNAGLEEDLIEALDQDVLDSPVFWFGMGAGSVLVVAVLVAVLAN